MTPSKKITSYILLCLFLIGCKKAGADSAQPLAPVNLQVTTQISTDGTGNVSFTATATNAASYSFVFGDGESKTEPDGTITYKYTLQGTNDYTVTVTATSSSGKSISKSVLITVNVQPATPTLFWSEEFNTNGAPNPAVWNYDTGNGDGGWGNQESQYYTSRAENVIVSDGTLKITAKKEDYNGFAYTSARLLTKGKFSFKYGKVEVSAKVPQGVGTWPAIWMLGSNFSTVGWPNCGEIDIMEHLGRQLNTIYGTLHYPGRFGGSANGATKVIENASTQFHTYTLDWTATYIKIYVDNQLFHTVANSTSIPFNHEFFLLLNVAMGGNFAGSIDPNVTSATMEVDYIRIYK